MDETVIETTDGGRDGRAHSAVAVSVGVVATMASYVVSIVLPEAKASTRAFSAHKSARSFARRSIREGADFVTIAFRPTDAEGSEADALRNVYRAEVDTVNHVRRHVRVSVDAWREVIARARVQGKVTAAEANALPAENIDEMAEDSRVKVARAERPARR